VLPPQALPSAVNGRVNNNNSSNNKEMEMMPKVAAAAIPGVLSLH
jgi:hypothetical protein